MRSAQQLQHTLNRLGVIKTLESVLARAAEPLLRPDATLDEKTLASGLVRLIRAAVTAMLDPALDVSGPAFTSDEVAALDGALGAYLASTDALIRQTQTARVPNIALDENGNAVVTLTTAHQNRLDADMTRLAKKLADSASAFPSTTPTGKEVKA
jgi:hypothetical protein